MAYEPNYNPDGTIKGYVQRNDAGVVTGFQESASSPVATAPVARYVGEGGAQYQGSAPVAPPADAKLSANGMYYDTAGNAYKAPTAVTRYGSPSATVGSMFGAGGAFDTTPVNETAIRDKARADVQAQIDAVNELAQSELVTASKNAEQRLGQTRALGAASGVLGSPTGEAQRQGTEVVNTQEQNAIKAATAAKIADILSGVNTRADTLVQNAKTLATGNAEKYVSFLKEQTTQAQSDFKALATGGVVLSGDQRTKLLEQTGYDPATFDALYKSIQVANTPKADIVGDPVKSGTKLIYTVKDPTSPNGLKQITLDAGVNVESGNYSITSDTNGVYLLNKDNGQYKLIGQPKDTSGGTDQLYNGLSAHTATAIRARVSKYASDNTIQNFSTVQDGYNFATSLDTNTKNPADDQALIYSLAKALDPGSVVREGEYATAQKYAQSWIAAYGKGISQALLGTGFLSTTARDNIKKTITEKFKSQQRSYEQTRGSYIQGINALTGRKDGEQFLTEFTTPPVDNGAGDEYTKAGAASVGSTVTIGGKTYKKTGADSYEPQ